MACAEGFTEHPRKGGQSLESWLLPASRIDENETGLSGWRIVCPEQSTTAVISSFDVREPPILKCWPFRIVTDALAQPEPTRIEAPADLVWKVFTDFGKYHEWNPFHQKVAVSKRVDVANDHDVYLCVRVALVAGWERDSQERIFYVDEGRRIFCYGLDDGWTANSWRSVWIEENEDGSCTFNSYDAIGGFVAGPFTRLFLEGRIQEGFASQHLALKERCEQMATASLSLN